jgi:pyridoxal phosphate enzyme (YggS family)
MPFLREKYDEILREISPNPISLVAVSKTKPLADLEEAYKSGVRDFGENYVQELVDKSQSLPSDIRWHFIGHLQTNKVKYIAPFVHLIHGVDSEKLLLEINKQGQKLNRPIECLLQIHIAQEETKFGFNETEVTALIEKYFSPNAKQKLPFVTLRGLMGMASFINDGNLIKKEFSTLKGIYERIRQQYHLSFDTLSMGMSNDYKLAIELGSTMVRIGSLLFGERNYNKL